MEGRLPDLSQLIPAIQARADDFAARAADAVRPYAPVGKTGQFAESLHGIADATADGFVASVVTESAVADYILNGTSPHDIEPSTKRALFWEGAEHPVRRVHHPGTAPNPFGEQAEGELADLAAQLVSDALEEVL